MRFNEFFKKYYEITNRNYSDKLIWDTNSDNYKKAIQKGQNPRMSKLERKISIIFQYVCLISLIAVSIIKPEIWFCSLLGVLLFALNSFITEFSLILIIVLFFSINNSSVYSKSWMSLFYGNLDLSYLTRLTKKEITGYITNRKSFSLPSKIVAICKNKSNSVSISFKVNKAILRINNEKQILNEEYPDINSLYEKIASIIINTISQP